MNNITIDLSRYEKLLEAEVKLNMIKRTVEQDNNKYSYSTETTSIVDAILGVERAGK